MKSAAKAKDAQHSTNITAGNKDLYLFMISASVVLGMFYSLVSAGLNGKAYSAQNEILAVCREVGASGGVILAYAGEWL